MPERWIEVVGWEKFQHYKKRRPAWIKVYTDLLDDDAYLGLPFGTRCLLIELWMLYGLTAAQVPLDTRSISRRLQHRVTMHQLELLNRAGFIRFRASKPLAGRYTRDRDIKDLENLGIENLLKNIE